MTRLLNVACVAALALVLSAAPATLAVDYQLTVNVEGWGSVDLPSGTYPEGTLTLTPTADPRWQFAWWVIEDAGGVTYEDFNNVPLNLTFDEDHAVTAVFVRSFFQVKDETSPCFPKAGGEVNISGATLFAEFFTVNASTNDIPSDPPFGDVDCDGLPNNPPPPDQLVTPQFNGFGWNGWWMVQYRGVGSGNGLKEFVNSQTDGVLPTGLPSDLGIIARHTYYDNGTIDQPWGEETYFGACCIGGVCSLEYGTICASLGGTYLGDYTVCDADTCGADPLGACVYYDAVEMVDVCGRMTESDCLAMTGTWHGAATVCGLPAGLAAAAPNYPFDAAGTPVAPTKIDLGVMDVPTTWFVVNPVPNATPDPDLLPGAAGYGLNPIASWDTGFSNQLKSLSGPSGASLNTNVGSPDANTVFDTPIAWVPISFIANRGTGLENVTIDQLRHFWLTGRGITGENIVAVTRDAGSGTRNGAMNGILIDPSWGRGDNVGNKTKVSSTELIGPNYQPTNKGGSSRMEGTVQNTRLAVGYTGLIGGSRSAADATAGKYELLNVNFVPEDANAQFVRPGSPILNLINNDPLTGWVVGSPETFASRGNPFEFDATAVTYMENQTAADYLRNIKRSVDLFTTVPGDPDLNGTPGQFLASQFVLIGAVDYVKDLNSPGWTANPDIVPALQQYTQNNPPNVSVPNYGITDANKVPTRTASPDWSTYSLDDCCGDTLPQNGQYGDGSTNGDYYNYHTMGYDIVGNTNLNLRNQIAGDFLNDFVRDTNDIAEMMNAYADPAAWVTTGNSNSTAADPVVPEIIGDFDGNGLFTCGDIRYFADGLAIDADPASDYFGFLNRRKGFELVDQNWAGGNFFGTTLATPKAYAAGDAAGDIAGNTPWPGARPHGQDCVVDANDIDYIAPGMSMGYWARPQDAIFADVSADLGGDIGESFVIDYQDRAILVQEILCTQFGDVNLDGFVNAADVAIVTSNQGMAGGWADGDLDGNGMVDEDDLALVNANLGFDWTTSSCTADFTGILDPNVDGLLNAGDIDAFVTALTQPATWRTTYPGSSLIMANDFNLDGLVNAGDIDLFVLRLTGQLP